MSLTHLLIINSPVLWGHLTQTNDFIQDFIFGLFIEFILQKEKKQHLYFYNFVHGVHLFYGVF